MNLINDLTQTISLVKQNRMIWWLGFLSLVYLLVPPRQFYEGNLCLIPLILAASIGSLIISTIASGGLIYAAHQLITGSILNFKEIWSISKGRSFRIYGAAIPISLILIGTNYLIYINDISHNWFFIEIVISLIIIGPFLIFSFCGILILDLRFLPATKISLTILVNNFKSVVLIMAVSTILRWIFLIIVYLFFSLISDQSMLPDISFYNYSVYQSLMNTPLFTWTNRLIYFLLWPFISVLFTSVFTRATSLRQNLDQKSISSSG